MSPPQDVALLPIQVTDQGFGPTGNAVTNLTRTLYTTARIFNAWSALGADTENVLTADKVAASDFLYSSSTVVGVDTSACPASPKPVMQWRLPDGIVVGNSIRQRIAAWHRDGMACVEVWASDGTTTTPSVFVSEVAATQESGDLWFANEYEVSVDISGLADVSNVTLHARGYPRLGSAASIRSTADETDAYRFSPRSYRRNTSRAAAPYIILVQSGGTDSTAAVVSQDKAAAYAAPCATLSYAFTRAAAVLGTGAALNGVEIHLGTSGHLPNGWQFASNTAVSANSAFIVIRPKDGVAKADCTFGFASVSGVTSRSLMVKFQGLKMLRPTAGAMTFSTQAGGHVWVDDCDLNVNANNGALVSGAGCQVSVTRSAISGITGTNASVLKGGINQIVRLLRGVSVAANGTTVTPAEVYNAVACEFTNVASDNSGTRNQSGMIVDACRFRAQQSTGNYLVIGQGGGTVTGFAVVNVEIENIGTGNVASLNVASDGPASTHGIVLNVTAPGFDLYGRSFFFYNEGVTATPHTLMRVEGSLSSQFNTKHDVFAGENWSRPDAATRTGAWSHLYGVGSAGNFSMYADGSGAAGTRDGFTQLYKGAGSNFGTSGTVKNDPLFIDPKHTESGPAAGAGGGNYRLQAGSPARGIVPVKPWTPKYDIEGVVRNGGATCAAGAYA